ncbi:MAG: hypothetical protein AAEI08_07125 [Gammaproteobacteria bacterium]
MEIAPGYAAHGPATSVADQVKRTELLLEDGLRLDAEHVLEQGGVDLSEIRVEPHVAILSELSVGAE